MKAQSTQSLSQSLYGSLPRSLKQDLLVKARMEDPDVLAKRRAVVASKSVSELSKITSISDFPVPSTLSRAFHKSMERLNGLSKPKPVTDDDSRLITGDTKARTLFQQFTLEICHREPDPFKRIFTLPYQDL